MLAFKVLHILSMFTAVTILVGGEAFFVRALKRGDIPAIKGFARVYDRADSIGVAALTIGVVFGLLTALTGGFDFVARWLIVAYVLVATIFIVGFSSGQYLNRLGALIQAETGDRPTGELATEVAKPRLLGSAVLSIILYVLIIIDMVAKPF